MMDRPTAVACSNYDVVKDSIGVRPPTNAFKGSCRGLCGLPGLSGSGSAPARDKLLQPEYRHNDCNDCTTSVALLVDHCVLCRHVTLVCLKSASMEIWSGKHTTLQNTPGGPARQWACSRVIAFMCELCGGSKAISPSDDSIMASTININRCALWTQRGLSFFLSFLYGVAHAPFACQGWGLPHRLAQCATQGKGSVMLHNTIRLTWWCV